MKKFIISLSVLIYLFISAFAPTIYVEAQTTGYEIDFDMTAEAVKLINLDTNTVVYEKNPDKRIYPASITKIMTFIVAMENISDIDKETFECKKEMFYDLMGTGAAMTGHKDGEIIPVKDLIYSLLIASGADDANALAYKVSGNIPDFVALMNSKAKEIGANETNFANPHGLHDPNHYSTVNDIIKIINYAMKLPLFDEIVNTTKYTMAKTNKREEKNIYTTNLMLDAARGGQRYYYRYARGIKTGFTDQAGRCLVSTASKNGYNYLSVIMGCQVKDDEGKYLTTQLSFIEAKQLYEWAFNSFQIKKIVDKNTVIIDTDVNYAWETDKIPLYPETDFSALIPVEINPDSIMKLPKVNQDISAPIKKGQVLGSIDYILAGKVIGTTNLVANQNIERSEILYFFELVKKVLINKWIVICLILFFILIAGYIVYAVIKNKKKNRNFFGKNYPKKKYKFK